jgi:O-antigen ligase
MAELSKEQALSPRLFYGLIFLYFALSSAELLHVVAWIYKPKVGHIVAVLLFGWVILEKRVWKIDREILRAFLLILGSLVVSAIFGAAPKRSLGYVGVYLFNFTFYFFLPIQVMHMVDVSRFFRLYWSAFVATGIYAALQVALSLFGIYDVFALQRVVWIARGQAWMYEPSYYALYMIPYVMYHNGMALLSPKAQRVKLIGQNMLMVISTSTGLIVSYPFFLLVSFALSVTKSIRPFRQLMGQKLKKAVVALGISLIVGAVFLYEIATHSIFKFFYFGFLTHDSFGARWRGIVASIKVFLRHPLIGAGLGGVSSEGFQEESVYDVKIETLSEFEAYDPTNCLTEVLASLGIVGLIALIYLGAIFCRAFQRVVTDSFIDLDSKKTAIALFISLIVMIIALQMNQGLFRPYVWIHAAVVYGYLRLLSSQSGRSWLF